MPNSPDMEKFKTLVTTYTKPIIDTLTWLVPIACLLYCLVEGVKWYTKPEQERAQTPYWSVVKNAVIVAIVITSISILLSIFGLNV